MIAMFQKLMMVDVDSTLYDANECFGRVCRDMGQDWWPEVYHYWFNSEDHGVTRETMTNLFRRAHSRTEIMKNDPYPGAVEVLRDFHDANPNWQIWYVSSRHPQTRGALAEWIEFHGFPMFDNVYVAMSKWEWMAENRPDIVIDDRVQTQVKAHYELGAQVYSIEQPHNINLRGEIPGIVICKDWHAIGDALKTTPVLA